MSSTEFNPQQRELLHQLALDSIRHGLQHGRALAVDATGFETALQQPRACFVTLTHHGELRGCIGHLEPIESLVEDVADNAYAAAFSDPRFAPVGEDELAGLQISISILGRPEAMSFASEADLISQIRPGIDGLILSGPAGHRGTFLPSVWNSLPQPAQFLQQLKRKAGLPADYWAEGMRVERYTTESF